MSAYNNERDKINNQLADTPLYIWPLPSSYLLLYSFFLITARYSIKDYSFGRFHQETFKTNRPPFLLINRLPVNISLESAG
jgi:hypothetical protein